MSDVKFRRPVVPGDQLRIEVNIVTWKGDLCKIEAKAFVEGNLGDGSEDALRDGRSGRACKLVNGHWHKYPSAGNRFKGSEAGRGRADWRVCGGRRGRGIGRRVHAARACGGARPSKFADNNVFHPFCVIGGDPQDYTFGGERVELQVGNANIFREHVTISRGTTKGGGVTRIGNDNFFLAYSHVGHDCQIGNNTLFVNGATLAGHVTVQDFVTLGAFSPVHQFCRLGRTRISARRR